MSGAELARKCDGGKSGTIKRNAIKSGTIKSGTIKRNTIKRDAHCSDGL